MKKLKKRETVLETQLRLMLSEMIKEEIASSKSVFVDQMAGPKSHAAKLVDDLKSEIIKLKDLSSKANKYGAPGGEQAKEYEQVLNGLYQLKKLLSV